MSCSETNYLLNDHWIGLMRGVFEDCVCVTHNAFCVQCRNSYVWADMSEMDYDGWSRSTQPGSSDCVRLSPEGWTEESCDTLLQFFCERSEFDTV